MFKCVAFVAYKTVFQ